MYVLSLRKTKGRNGDKYVVYRAEWDEFLPGEWLAVNARAVSGAFTRYERTKEFAAKYTAEHPGHTRKPAEAVALRQDQEGER